MTRSNEEINEELARIRQNKRLYNETMFILMALLLGVVAIIGFATLYYRGLV